MSTLKVSWLTIVIAVAAIGGWIAQRIASGAGVGAPVLHWTSLITMAAVSVLAFVLGFRVLRYRQGKATVPIDPILAARTLVLAQAGAYGGAVIGGWHLGILLDLMGAGSTGSASLVSCIVMMVGALVMVIVGFVVERFCKLPPEDMDGPSTPRRGRGTKGETEGYAARTH